MKLICAIFALCWLAVNADSDAQLPLNLKGMVDKIPNALKKISVEAANAIGHQLDQIVVDPAKEVEAKVQSIENLRKKNAPCVDAENGNINATVNSFHKSISECGIAAAKDSADIVADIIVTTQKLIFEGIDLIRFYRKCQSYTNIFMKRSCLTRFATKASLYVKKSRKTIQNTKENTKKRVPEVTAKADACTHKAADKAITELNNIHVRISNCIDANAQNFLI